MRSLGFVCLITAGVSAIVFHWRPELAQHPTWTEWSKDLPGDWSFPVWMAIIGGILTVPSLLQRRWRPEGGTVLHEATNYQKQPTQPPKHRAKTSTGNGPSPSKMDQNEPTIEFAPPDSELDTDWRETLIHAMGEFQTGQGVSLFLNKSDGVPITLVLERCTPGRTRRALDQLGKFLKRVPTPPRVMILFQNCEAGNVPWSKMVLGCLSPHIGRNAARMVGQPDRVDLFFHDSDPRYAESSAPSFETSSDPH